MERPEFRCRRRLRSGEQRLQAFAETCSERQEALLVEQQGQLASLQGHLEQQISQAASAAPPSPLLYQLHKLQKALVRRKRFAQALEVLRAVDALERQEADEHRHAARQANARALQELEDRQALEQAVLQKQLGEEAACIQADFLAYERHCSWLQTSQEGLRSPTRPRLHYGALPAWLKSRQPSPDGRQDATYAGSPRQTAWHHAREQLWDAASNDPSAFAMDAFLALPEVANSWSPVRRRDPGRQAGSPSAVNGHGRKEGGGLRVSAGPLGLQLVEAMLGAASKSSRQPGGMLRLSAKAGQNLRVSLRDPANEVCNDDQLDARDLEVLSFFQEASELWSNQHAWSPGSPTPGSPLQATPPTQEAPADGLHQSSGAFFGSQQGRSRGVISEPHAKPVEDVAPPLAAIKAVQVVPGVAPASKGMKERAAVENGVAQDSAWTIAARVVSNQALTEAPSALSNQPAAQKRPMISSEIGHAGAMGHAAREDVLQMLADRLQDDPAAVLELLEQTTAALLERQADSGSPLPHQNRTSTKRANAAPQESPAGSGDDQQRKGSRRPATSDGVGASWKGWPSPESLKPPSRPKTSRGRPQTASDIPSLSLSGQTDTEASHHGARPSSSANEALAVISPESRSGEGTPSRSLSFRAGALSQDISRDADRDSSLSTALREATLDGKVWSKRATSSQGSITLVERADVSAPALGVLRTGSSTWPERGSPLMDNSRESSCIYSKSQSSKERVATPSSGLGEGSPMGRGQRSLDALRPSVFQGTPAAADQSVAQPSASDPPKQPKAAPLKRVLSITGFRGIRRWVSYPGSSAPSNGSSKKSRAASGDAHPAPRKMASFLPSLANALLPDAWLQARDTPAASQSGSDPQLVERRPSLQQMQQSFTRRGSRYQADDAQATEAAAMQDISIDDHISIEGLRTRLGTEDDWQSLVVERQPRQAMQSHLGLPAASLAGSPLEQAAAAWRTDTRSNRLSSSLAGDEHGSEPAQPSHATEDPADAATKHHVTFAPAEDLAPSAADVTSMEDAAASSGRHDGTEVAPAAAAAAAVSPTKEQALLSQCLQGSYYEARDSLKTGASVDAVDADGNTAVALAYLRLQRYDDLRFVDSLQAKEDQGRPKKTKETK
ncbi:hypothetical protein WJX84_002947 [Apatococcus fuscideae]|uniref:Uncharacterized protein n=1 Tax=Apatococcus fuscideae TaxID=2026836 RepID=A0AAW1TBE5_9CHLO